MSKIAVVGGGIFGVTAAIYASREGHEVHLFEERGDILQAASGINQYRLHRGYHYPRSSETATSVIAAEASFRSEYGSSIIEGGRHLYAIAKKGSAVNAEQFLAFCDLHYLAYKVVEPDMVNPAMISLVIEAEESRFDPLILRQLAKEKLDAAGVQLFTHTRPDRRTLDSYDTTIIAAYAATNSVAAMLGEVTQEFQFEICEKPVVSLGSDFGQTDLVVMDGPFMCIDPFGTTSQYLLGNVVHAIHATNVGLVPLVPDHFSDLLNAGIVQNPHTTNFQKFIERGSEYIPILATAKHVGSMFTVRTVLPRVENTDARPTLVQALSPRCIRIFSGKIGNCVESAKQAVALIPVVAPALAHA